MLSKANAVETTYREMEKIIGNLVECYAIPHTRMCMRWSKPTKKAYREEVVGWLEDYSKSFRRLPKKSLPGREDLPTFARGLLDAEIARILKGDNPEVERSYAHLFS
ncbi:MAG TPA: hypothetical protein HA326_05345 [Thermoplasmata archaeon]|nr:hypothetical protein [Thermoplasmata archaeon]